MIRAERQEQNETYQMVGMELQRIVWTSCGDGLIRKIVVESIDIRTIDWTWNDIMNVFNPSF